MAINKLDPENVRALAVLMKDYLSEVDMIEALPKGYGFDKVRSGLKRRSQLTLRAVEEVSKMLRIDQMEHLWQLAKATVNANIELRKAIILASPVEGERIRALAEARKDHDLFDVSGMPCHFERGSNLTWN